MRCEYKDGSCAYVQVGDIVMLREGEVQIVGEVIFREKVESLDQGIDGRQGIHVRALLEMVEEEGKCGMVERSGRIIRNVRPGSLTRVRRRDDEVRYMSGERIMDGDIVVDPYTMNIEKDIRIVNRHSGRIDYDDGEERTCIELTTPRMNVESDALPGATIYEYWEDEGFVSDSMQHFFFICRASVPDTYY